MANRKKVEEKAAFEAAVCTLPHEDGTSCVPTLVGYRKYVCFYREWMKT